MLHKYGKTLFAPLFEQNLFTHIISLDLVQKDPHICANKCALWDVMQCPNSPSLGMCLEQLELDGNRELGNTISTSIGARAPGNGKLKDNIVEEKNNHNSKTYHTHLEFFHSQRGTYLELHSKMPLLTGF